MARQRKLTHVDRTGRPRMVDVGGKPVTHRVALAESRLVVPPEVVATLRDNAGRSSKGPVFDTAVVAGVMAAKRTHELIPFCHPLGLDDCRVDINFDPDDVIVVRCRVAVHHRTGVEMEALTGASVAALTVYDMLKALSQQIVIGPIRVLGKRGGRHDFGSVGDD